MFRSPIKECYRVCFADATLLKFLFEIETIMVLHEGSVRNIRYFSFKNTSIITHNKFKKSEIETQEIIREIIP